MERSRHGNLGTELMTNTDFHAGKFDCGFGYLLKDEKAKALQQ